MNTTVLKTAAALVLACGSIAVQAQTPPAPATPPANVGVSQGTAAEAASKAVPRSDTGTLVRTGPTATDRAGAAADRAGAAADSARSSMGTSNNAADTGNAATAPARRAPRADRN